MKTTIITTVIAVLIHFQTPKKLFDIPAINGKSISQIKKILGRPKMEDIPTDYQTKSGSYGDAFFEKEGFILEITYNPTNGKVNDYFISKDNAIADYKILEAAGNVLNTSKFILTPVHSNRNPSLFTGVTVTSR